MGKRTLSGVWLIAAITSVCATGFLLFGYDQGVMSGVVISKYWLAQMDHPSALMTGTMTALYDVGAVLGAIFAAFTGERLGRKRTLILGTVTLLLGSILMGTSYGRPQFMVARIVTGVGIGYITSVAPVYQAEISEAQQRGWHVCCQLSVLLFGLMVAYWINLGFYYVHNSAQWRFPLLFQIVFCAYILVVTPFLPDTPRWLMRHGQEKEGLDVLARLRNQDPDHEKVQLEKDEIMEAIAIEDREEGSWKDLFRDGGLQADKRFYLALGIQFMQQMSGINIVTYYAPTLFTTSLHQSQHTSLLTGCLLQLWYLLASFVTWFTIDRVGRRRLFILMALGMCLVLVAESVSVYFVTHSPSDSATNKAAGISAVFFVFAFEACFTWGWMATVWVYSPEIQPLRTRAKGAALAAGADFLGNFLVVMVTPVGVDNLGWRFYVIWAVLNCVNAGCVWALYPETAGVGLEAIDRVFVRHGADAAVEGGGNWITKRLQWSVVRKADRLRKEYREHRKSTDEGLGVRRRSLNAANKSVGAEERHVEEVK